MHTDAASLSDFVTLLQSACLCAWAQLWMDRVHALQRVKSSCLRVGSNLGSPTALSPTATEHGYIGLDCQLSVRRLP